MDIFSADVPSYIKETQEPIKVEFGDCRSGIIAKFNVCFLGNLQEVVPLIEVIVCKLTFARQ